MSGLVRAEWRFRARRRAERRRAARPLVLVATTVTLVAAVAWAALSSPALRLDSVHVSGLDATSRLTVQQVLDAARAPIGRSLLRISPGAIRARVAALPAVAAVQVRRQWPHGVAIDVTARTPVAAVTGSGRSILVDRSGVAFAAVAAVVGPSRLLDLRLGAPLPVGAGSPGAADARAGLAVWMALPARLRGQVRWVTATSPDAVSFGLGPVATVVWGSPDDGAAKLAALTALLRHPAHRYDVSTPEFAVTAG